MTQLVLSLGSNIEREKHIRFGVTELERAFGSLLVSPVYETVAVGFDGPDFYNLVVVAETGLALGEIMEKIRGIEAAAGRIRGEKRFQSRSLDIDVLLFGEADLRPRGYDIPRDEIEHAAYVLKPLADLLPDQPHPLSGISFGQMWRVRMQGQSPMRLVDVGLATVGAHEIA